MIEIGTTTPSDIANDPLLGTGAGQAAVLLPASGSKRMVVAVHLASVTVLVSPTRPTTTWQ